MPSLFQRFRISTKSQINIQYSLSCKRNTFYNCQQNCCIFISKEKLYKSLIKRSGGRNKLAGLNKQPYKETSTAKSVREQQKLVTIVGVLQLSTVGLLFGTACNLPRPPRAEMKNYSAIFNTRLEHRKRTKIREKRRGSTCTAPLRSKYAGNYCAPSELRSKGIICVPTIWAVTFK